MADVVLDDLYASAGENAVQQQQEAPAAEAEAAPGADIKSLSHEQLLESLRCGDKVVVAVAVGDLDGSSHLQ
jgi:hypothetical protein